MLMTDPVPRDEGVDSPRGPEPEALLRRLKICRPAPCRVHDRLRAALALGSGLLIEHLRASHRTALPEEPRDRRGVRDKRACVSRGLDDPEAKAGGGGEGACGQCGGHESFGSASRSRGVWRTRRIRNRWRYRSPPWMRRDVFPLVPLAKSPFSTSADRYPRSVAASAVQAPTMPPPITRMSTGEDAIASRFAARVRTENSTLTRSLETASPGSSFLRGRR